MTSTAVAKTNPGPAPWKGAVAGAIAGIAASLAMDLFQRAVSAASGDTSGSDEEPATDRAADAVAQTATGRPLPEDAKPFGGQLVHYLLGAGLGLAYGVAAEYRPAVTTGEGALFGLGTAAVLDETAVPLVGLGAAPWDTGAGSHLYAVASHLVFGTATELVRATVRGSFDPQS